MINAPSLLRVGLGSMQNRVCWGGWGSWESPGAQQSWVPGLTQPLAGQVTLAGLLSFIFHIYDTGIQIPPHRIAAKIE